MPRPKVYVSRNLIEPALQIIARECDMRVYESADYPVPRETLMKEVAQADGALVLLTDRIDAELMDAAPRCRVYANHGVGYDNIDLPAATKRGILVTNTPGVLTETTADLTFALLMATARRLYEAQRVVVEGRWNNFNPMWMTGQDIYGATLGIIGAGRIGSAVARRAKGFGMRIIYHNRRRSPELEAEVGAEFVPFDDLLRQSDFVSMLAPLTPETRGMFGAREFGLMKPTAVFINTARGPVADDQALYDALTTGKIWAAGLDVYAKEPVDPNHPLLQLPNVTALPHIGSASIATRTRMATLAAENLVAAVTGRRPPTPVNPEVLD